MVRAKTAQIHGVAVTLQCAECGKGFRKWKWSPLFCPECDEVRVNRISSQLDAMVKSMEAKHEL